MKEPSRRRVYARAIAIFIAVGVAVSGLAVLQRMRADALDVVIIKAQASSVAYAAEHHVVGAVDGALVSWAEEDGRIVASSPSLGINCVAVDADGKIIASGGKDASIRLWTPTGEALCNVAVHTTPSLHVAFSPSGRLVTSAAYDSVAVLDVTDARHPLLVRNLHDNTAATRVAVGIDNTLGIGYQDGSVRLTAATIPAATYREVQPVRRGAMVSGLAFSSTGEYLAVANVDQPIRVWRFPEMAEFATLKRTRADSRGSIGFTSVAFSPKRDWIAGGASDGLVCVWTLPDCALIEMLRVNLNGITSLCFSDDDEVISLGFEGRICISSLRRNALRRRLPRWAIPPERLSLDETAAK